MRPFERDADQPLDPEAERTLEAIDRALAAEEVDRDLATVATLATDLRAERPEPREEWRLQMDVRAGAGFRSGRLAGVAGRLRDAAVGVRPRRLLVAAGAAAAVLAVIGVSIGALRGGSGAGGGEALTAPAAPDRQSTTPAPPTTVPAPEAGQGPARAADSSEPSTSGSGSAGAVEKLLPDATPITPGGDRTAPGASKRRQDRSASLALKTSTSRVRDVSDQAIQITESAGGVVLSSQLTEQGDRASADLQLSIPSRELDATLDRLTDLATVESLSEGSIDITRPFVSARERLRDARAERRKLLKALGNASSDNEVEALRKQLRQVRRKISRRKSAFENVARRARNSNVNVRIEGTPGGDGSGGWSLGNAADDALGVLEAIAGGLLVAAAVLAPLALVIGGGVALALVLRRRRRERALDG